MEGGNIPMSPRNNADHLRIMIAAVDAVISGSMSQREAAKAFNIPRSTLRSHLPRYESYKHRITRIPTVSKNKTVLSKKEEKELVDYVISMHRAGFGRTRQDLLYKVQELLNKSERKTEFDNNLPNNEWYEAFLNRHKDSIQQYSFGSDLQEVGVIPVAMHGGNQTFESAIQSVSNHPGNRFHHDNSTPTNIIHHPSISPDNVARCRALTFQFQL